MNFLKKCVFLIAAIVLTVAGQSFADTDAPEWVDFYGNVSVNGNPAPVGTVVEAFDPDNVLCGSYIVDSTGIYGFLHANRDDIDTPGTDEGATPGDSIRLVVNGINADVTVVSGGLTWTSNGEQNNIDLTITTQTIAFTVLTTPADTLAAPGWTVTFGVEIRNDGNGTDFYGVNALPDTNASPGWSTVNQDSLSHAVAGGTTWVYFDVDLAVFGGGADTSFTVHYTVYSAIDTSVNYSDWVVINKSITDVNENDPLLPDGFSLAQNYPNPFNPTTTISFTLPQKSNVSLEIFNTLGQLVEVKNLGNLPVGLHEVEFDASDLSSGVYFYRLQTDIASVSKKMLLLK